TVGTLKAIKTASTGRRRPEDADLFEITIGGAVLAGVLYPEVTPEDVKAVARVYWRRLIKPAVRKQKRRAVRAVTRPVKQATRRTVAAAKAAALEAAWTVQAGGYEPGPGYQPEPINPCAACEGRGAHTLDSRLHATTTVRSSARQRTRGLEQDTHRAWSVRAGGSETAPDSQPEPINPCAACEGRGAHTLPSRLHATTTVRCSVCHGTGEID